MTNYIHIQNCYNSKKKGIISRGRRDDSTNRNNRGSHTGNNRNSKSNGNSRLSNIVVKCNGVVIGSIRSSCSRNSYMYY